MANCIRATIRAFTGWAHKRGHVNRDLGALLQSAGREAPRDHTPLWKKFKLYDQRPLKWAISGDHISGYASLLVSDLEQMFLNCCGTGLILAAIVTKFTILKMLDLTSCT